MSKATIFNATVEGFRTTKKGYSITLLLPKKSNEIEQVTQLMKFDKMPVLFALKADEEAQEEKEGKITEEQRKAIFALIKILADHYGYEKEEARKILTSHFCEQLALEQFSLSDVSKEIATDFIQTLLELALGEGLDVFNWLRDNEELAIILSVKYKRCVVCAKVGDIHHIDRIGMGNNRNKIDDSEKRKVCLCREHHTELHTIGDREFSKKYHINISR